jgi:hypothetical protein
LSLDNAGRQAKQQRQSLSHRSNLVLPSQRGDNRILVHLTS